MNIDSLNKWLMLAAIVGVIAGILFLAVEIQQNNTLLESEARASHAEITTNIWELLLNDTDPVPLLIKDRNGEELTEFEEFKLNAWWMVALFGNQYTFYELPDANAGWVSTMSISYQTYPSLRRTWQGNSNGSRSAESSSFDQRYIDFFNENVINR